MITILILMTRVKIYLISVWGSSFRPHKSQALFEIWRRLKTKWNENNVAMKCFDCGSIGHPSFHKECPNQISRVKNKPDILDGVHSQQLNKGSKPSEIQACPAFAFTKSLQIENEENCAE